MHPDGQKRILYSSPPAGWLAIELVNQGPRTTTTATPPPKPRESRDETLTFSLAIFFFFFFCLKTVKRRQS
jgi:hypothetical protein